MSRTGKIVRKIKEAPLLNEVYRYYTEFKVARGYKNRSTLDVFTEINTLNKWGGKESVSGLGSDFLQTKVIIEEIPRLLPKLNIEKFIDIPCGDHHWIKEIDFSNVKYIGCDIVENLIMRNQELYGNEYKKFMVCDIIEDELPKGDIILVRDCFVHLSFQKIESALKNVKKSGIKYLLTTSFPQTKRNYDITTGNWRPLNLTLAPFHFPAPLVWIVENCTESYGQYSDKSLGLWDIEKLPSF